MLGAENSSANVVFYFEDMLGTSRVIVNSSGTLLDDSDFYPFGGEHAFTSSSGNTYKFTGVARFAGALVMCCDPCTGNDDFGARYYSPRGPQRADIACWGVGVYGRFLSADWSAVPAPVPYANLTNPQTLNLYAIVSAGVPSARFVARWGGSNNPESFADLDGHARWFVGGFDSGCGLTNTSCPTQLSTTANDTNPAQQSSPPPQQQKEQDNKDQQRVGNIVNETGGLRPETKTGGGSAQDLHDAKVAIANVVENREKAGIQGGVASDKVGTNERNSQQYKDAQKAAAEAGGSSDSTRGSKNFYLDYGQKPPKWAAGKETTSYGPFKNSSGGGDVPKGADVRIVIIHPENQQ